MRDNTCRQMRYIAMISCLISGHRKRTLYHNGSVVQLLVKYCLVKWHSLAAMMSYIIQALILPGFSICPRFIGKSYRHFLLVATCRERPPVMARAICSCTAVLTIQKS